MSSDLSDRQWRFYVDDMLGFCDRVLRFGAGVSRENFAADPMRYDATVRNIELIGEAVTHIPLVVKKGWAFFYGCCRPRVGPICSANYEEYSLSIRATQGR